MDTVSGGVYFLNGCAPSQYPLPNMNTLRQLGSVSALKTEWETEGTHISEQAHVLDIILASVPYLSQLVGIHILAKQKDNYASALCKNVSVDELYLLLISWTDMFLWCFLEYVSVFFTASLTSWNNKKGAVEVND